MAPTYCFACKKAVYAAEEKKNAGVSFHKFCFKCVLCNKRLDSTTVTEHEKSLYCKNCHGKKYGPKGVGFGGGAGTLSMDSGERHGLEKDPSKMSGSGIACAYVASDMSVTPAGPGQKACPRCGGAVYPAEEAVGAGGTWHKKCFRCCNCKKGLDSTNCCDREGEIFCKGKYNKVYSN
ncbi:cysteine and glycine-rich protein 1-like [Anneissia japonica]|uniref:cysteine and glycine-rich protein 1-like n=1 Tax=Anneissia japonica TaxID=1529436 RepID=UPI0014255A48|nr:cysteine and glycine-rich protein 1-like [Anneissia japonica]